MRQVVSSQYYAPLAKMVDNLSDLFRRYNPDWPTLHRIKFGVDARNQTTMWNCCYSGDG